MRLLLAALASVVLTACAGNTEVVESGSLWNPAVLSMCAARVTACQSKDYNNLTYSENLEEKPRPIPRWRTRRQKARAETPAQLEKTISELEQNPELIDTMAE